MLSQQKATDIAIFVVRKYGGEHLNTRRYELIQETAVNAYEQLKLISVN